VLIALLLLLLLLQLYRLLNIPQDTAEVSRSPVGTPPPAAVHHHNVATNSRVPAAS
jgi:hypothetical protein